MIQRLKPQSEFGRNVLTLMTGTTIAQAIPIAITPILTRLYTPEDFGVYGLFIGLILILAIFATARFEQALFLVKNKKVMDLIVKFVLVNALFFSTAVLLAVILLNDQLLQLNENLTTAFLYLMPFGVFIVASYVVLRSWLNRHADYSTIRSNLIKQSMAFSMLQVLFGLVEKLQSVGLFLGDVLGKALTTVLIIKKMNLRYARLTARKYRYIWQRYKGIPIYQLPAAVINTSAVYAPMVLLPVFFGAGLSGAFFLVFKVLMSPVSIIGNAILDVFKVNAANAILEKGECKAEFVKTFKLLLVIAVAIFLFFFILSETLFQWVFGTEWMEAGQMASILAILAATRFLVSPLSYVFILKKKFRLNLMLQIFTLISSLVSIGLGVYYDSFYLFLYWYVGLNLVFYLLMLIIAYKLSGKNLL